MTFYINILAGFDLSKLFSITANFKCTVVVDHKCCWSFQSLDTYDILWEILFLFPLFPSPPIPSSSPPHPYSYRGIFCNMTSLNIIPKQVFLFAYNSFWVWKQWKNSLMGILTRWYRYPGNMNVFINSILIFCDRCAFQWINICVSKIQPCRVCVIMKKYSLRNNAMIYKSNETSSWDSTYRLDLLDS